ncbi:hypothetical protein TNCV_4046311 [Trichonephila clavipes]|nr:hypothetical protein TNCV_4046311 [Trichonephila clavipes]
MIEGMKEACPGGLKGQLESLRGSSSIHLLHFFRGLFFADRREKLWRQPHSKDDTKGTAMTFKNRVLKAVVLRNQLSSKPRSISLCSLGTSLAIGHEDAVRIYNVVNDTLVETKSFEEASDSRVSAFYLTSETILPKRYRNESKAKEILKD